MENTKTNKYEEGNVKTCKDLKIRPALKAYIEARNMLVEKYAAKLPEWDLL